MAKFTLTIRQLEKVIKDAKKDIEQEDMVTFEVNNNRLIISQKNWGHTDEKKLMDKPC